VTGSYGVRIRAGEVIENGGRLRLKSALKCTTLQCFCFAVSRLPREVVLMFKTLFAVGLTFIVALTLSASVFGAPWYTENFNELKDGPLTPQDGWEDGANASGMIQDKIAYGDSGQSLYIVENSGNQKKFESGHVGLQYLAFWAYVPEENPVGNLQIYTGAGGWNSLAFFSRIYGNKQIAAHVGDKQGHVLDTKYTEVTYEYGQWFHVRYVMDFDSQTYSIYINGEMGIENIAFRGDANEMSWLEMRWDEDDKLEIYIDEIELGDGLGEDAQNLHNQEAVSQEGKLSITWGYLKKV